MRPDLQEKLKQKERDAPHLHTIFPCTSPDTISDVSPTYLVRISPLILCFVSGTGRIPRVLVEYPRYWSNTPAGSSRGHLAWEY